MSPSTLPLAAAVSPGHDHLCARCMECPAVVCHECVRALALKSWGAIARHAVEDVTFPQAGECRMCEIGLAHFCGDCFIEELVEYRALLRAAGHPIERETGWWRPRGVVSDLTARAPQGNRGES